MTGILTARGTLLLSFANMSQQSFEEFLIKKAYEVGYAVFRLTGTLEARQELRTSLEANATRLLEEAVRGNMNAVSRHARVLEYMLRLGGDTGALHTNHVNLVINELANLESDIAGQQFNLQVNMQNEIQSAIQNINQSASQSAIADYGPESEVIIDENGLENSQEDSLENSEDNGERQDAILQFIMQSGHKGCRFKDIFDGLQYKLGDAGERTVRYDLQELIKRGVIEKYGPGGAYTYYRAKV